MCGARFRNQDGGQEAVRGAVIENDGACAGPPLCAVIWL